MATLNIRYSRVSEPCQSAQPHPWCATYRAALDLIDKFARDRTAAILIEGESGTGKTLLARRVHELSPRRAAPFRQCVLSAMDDNFASDELFGHVPGAYTGARDGRAGLFVSAAGGTVFLDEIGKASLYVQQKLLHAIEYGEVRPLGSDREIPVDVRIVAATNIPIVDLVEQRQFLPDLYARLKTFRIILPALRERASDIPYLVRLSVAHRAGACGYEVPPNIADDLMESLVHAKWPDNLRELDAAVHRLLVEAAGAEVLTLRHAADLLLEQARSQRDRRLEPEAVRDALIRSRNKKAGAARLLGVSRSTIYRMLDADEHRADKTHVSARPGVP